MAEYIERKKAIDSIVKAVDTGFAVTAEDLVGILDDLPAADVAPVVHAQWENRSGIITCSKCGQGHMLAMYPHYCDNCGAKMDGVERSGHD